MNGVWICLVLVCVWTGCSRASGPEVDGTDSATDDAASDVETDDTDPGTDTAQDSDSGSRDTEDSERSSDSAPSDTDDTERGTDSEPPDTGDTAFGTDSVSVDSVLRTNSAGAYTARAMPRRTQGGRRGAAF